MADLLIKDVAAVTTPNLTDKMPVSQGGTTAATITPAQIIGLHTAATTHLEIGITSTTAAAGDHGHNGVYAPVLGSDDNYVTDAEKTKLANLSGTNTGDQDLSGYSATSHNHALSNLTEKSYNSLTDKPTIPSITGLLDETAHDALDHTGLTGIPAAYSLPTASTTVLGGVKVDGTTVTITDGVISSTATGGVTDHGALSGLSDDDHSQYLNETRHDALDHTGLTGIPTAYTDEMAQDAVGALISAGTQSGITVTYDDANNKLDFTVVASGSGDVTGPASSTDSNFALFSGTTGKVLKDGSVKASDFATATHDHTGVYQPAGAYSTDIHSNITALNAVSGTNTGDQDLSGYSPTTHNHALNNLTEKSYNSLTDKPSIPSITGLLDETAHDALDHTGLTGIPAAYSLPTATTSVLGGVKVDGTSITINSGVISSSATGGGMTSESKSSSFTAAKDHRYIVDTSAGTVTATLPASPSAGDYIEFVDSGSTWTGHDLVLARNSLKINGETTDFTCDADNVQVSITYTGATYGWAVKVGASVLTAAPHTTGSHSDWPAGVSMTEVGYLDGVTALIQDVIVQRVEATPYSTYSTDNTHSFPIDNTTPQNTEGSAYCSVTITPTSASNKLVIEGTFYGGTDGANHIAVSICDTGINDCLAAVVVTNTAGGYAVAIPVNHTITAGSTAARTYQLRAGTQAGTLHINGTSTSNQLFNGKLATRLSVTEVRV